MDWGFAVLCSRGYAPSYFLETALSGAAWFQLDSGARDPRGLRQIGPLFGGPFEIIVMHSGSLAAPYALCRGFEIRALRGNAAIGDLATRKRGLCRPYRACWWGVA